jgi:predicted O-methyltransferase YrrM
MKQNAQHRAVSSPLKNTLVTKSVSKNVARRLWQTLFSFTDLDVRGMSWRLGEIGARHAEISGVLSLDDAPGTPNERLFDLVPEILRVARKEKLELLAARNVSPLVMVWPGEHYRLLAAIVRVTQPHRIVEIGTASGLSALAMLLALPDDGRITTFDILPWHDFPDTCLTSKDFETEHLQQIVCDLGNITNAVQYAPELREADLIFVDAAKDGRLERDILANLAAVGPKSGCLLVFDDIRLRQMLAIWRGIVHPKLDLTSFGHWSGTGVVEWTNL